MRWAKWFYPPSALVATGPIESWRASVEPGSPIAAQGEQSSSTARVTPPRIGFDSHDRTNCHTTTPPSVECESKTIDPTTRHSMTPVNTSVPNRPAGSNPKTPPPRSDLPQVGSLATRIRGTSLTRLDTTIIRHTRSVSAPNQPFISARPVAAGRNRSYTPGLDDQTDRWYNLSYHSPISPHPAPQTPLPPLPTEIESPERQTGSQLEPLEESPVLPRHPHRDPKDPTSPRSLAP